MKKISLKKKILFFKKPKKTQVDCILEILITFFDTKFIRKNDIVINNNIIRVNTVSILKDAINENKKYLLKNIKDICDNNIIDIY